MSPYSQVQHRWNEHEVADFWKTVLADRVFDRAVAGCVVRALATPRRLWCPWSRRFTCSVHNSHGPTPAPVHQTWPGERKPCQTSAVVSGILWCSAMVRGASQ